MSATSSRNNVPPWARSTAPVMRWLAPVKEPSSAPNNSDRIKSLLNMEQLRATNGPLLPGDPEREAEKERARTGIPLLPAVVEELRQISRQTGVPFE